MFAGSLQSIADSGFWTAYCRTPGVDGCYKGNCSGSSFDGTLQSVVIKQQLAWVLFGSCSFSAFTSIVYLLLLFSWLIGFVRNLCKPVGATTSEDKNDRRVVEPRARLYFVASISASALLFTLNLTIAVLQQVGRWPRLSVDAKTTTWITCAGWLIVTVSSNSSRVGKKRTIPVIVRGWWMAAFALSLLSLISNILNYQESHWFTSEDFIETACIPVTGFLFAVALSGRTGFLDSVEQNGGLKEPLLQGQSTSTEEEPADNPGVTPYATAGFFSLISSEWLTPLISAGYRKPLDLKDVPVLAPQDASRVNYLKFKHNWEQQSESRETPSLVWAIALTFWRSALFNATLAGVNTVAGYTGPFLIEDFVDYLAGRRRFAYEGYVLVLCFFIAKTMETISGRVWYQGMQLLGLKIRSSLTGFAYRKGLNLSNQARQGHTSGEIVNYVLVDARRISDFAWWFHDIWVLPFQVTLALLILFKVVGGWPTLAAFGASLFVMALNLPVSKLQDDYQDRLMEAKDKRMKSLTEVLRSMRILKLQAWETRYHHKVEELRKLEYYQLRGSLYARATMTFLFWTAPIFVSVATFGTCILVGTPLTAGRILSALATFRILQEPLIEAPEFISTLTQTRVSIARLQKYAVEEELQEDAVIRSSSATSSKPDVAIEINGGEFKWDPSAETPDLSNINLKVEKGQRVAICGTVGSGKSTLLSCILGEITRVAGTVEVIGTTAYVAQTAWIQSKKLEDNILFGRPMDQTRYTAVVKACALEKDLEVLSHGDKTIIGERGINMSGGQKQRIQLARAVYQDAEIYLLDDPFSAVDAHTGSELFTECLLGVLSQKTILYVTHQVEFLPKADLILVMRDGKIVQAGKYDDLLEAGTDFNILVNAHNEAMDMVVANGFMKETKEEDAPGLEEVQTPDTDDVVQTVNQLTRKKSVEEIIIDKKQGQLIEEEERAVGHTSLSIYWAYITAIYNGALIPVLIIAQISFELCQVASNYWMAYNTPATEGETPRVDNKTLILGYCIFALGSSFVVSIRAFLQSTVALLTAQKFFNNMMKAIFNAPMGFFDSTPTGRILARASSDQNTVDTEISFTFNNVMVFAAQLTCIVVIMSQITWQIYFLFVPVMIACISMQRFYVRASRELQRLTGTLRSPIIHHYSESIAGGATLRGFCQLPRFLDTIFEVYDRYGRTVFHNFSAIQWLMFRMEMLSNLVFIFSLLYAVTFVNKMDPGLAGLGVTYGLQLNMLISYFVWSLCNLENRIISVERILQYTKIDPEAPVVIEDSRPPTEWPSEGTIELDNLQVRYSDKSPMVLHGLTCTFPAGQKIGVVGRTASGKSTLIQALFRIVEPCGGKIIIDNIDISTIGLHDLRRKLSIIPQEPTLFEGTMRMNLDPLGEHSDEEIWEALDKCQLGDTVRGKEEKLDCPVNENGENWSVGQRQLVCLGRALLKRTSILVLDEATASVDSATDGVIQRTIRAEFKTCTVLTVAHRIPTVIDSDGVLVLSYGKIAEYNSPLKLLEDKNSLFYKLVAEYSTRSESKSDNSS